VNWRVRAAPLLLLCCSAGSRLCAQASAATDQLREAPRSDSVPVLSLPGFYGARLPQYDRVNGVSFAAGPLVTLHVARLELEPVLTYRSNLGVFDPLVVARIGNPGGTSLQLAAGRTTSTNDAWIWSNPVNSAAVLGFGIDTRNYYRAERAEATIRRRWFSASGAIEPYLGARGERNRSVGFDSVPHSAPWSASGREAADRMLRPNPPVANVTLRSAIAGLLASWETDEMRAAFSMDNEAVAGTGGVGRFLQSTLDGLIAFHTFGTQSFTFSTHLVGTVGDSAPPQRWAYVGGPGTLPTLDLLSMGGDRLVYRAGDYHIPLDRLTINLLGSPTVTLHQAIAAAGVSKLPAFEQTLALRLDWSFIRLSFNVDPARRKSNVAVGLASMR
jgi:hypothetical protein